MSKDNKEKEKPTFLNWLGLSEKPDLSRGRPLGALLGAVTVAMLLTATGAAFAVLISTYWQAFSDSGPSLGAGTLIIGLLGAPFLIWRTLVAQRTVELADASLFNDKLGTALQSLAARRQVTRILKDDNGREEGLSEWEDDIITRVTAIDRLFGLAEERPSEAGRIATVLSTYIREISREVTPHEHPRSTYLFLREGGAESPGLGDTEINARLGIDPREVTLQKYLYWVRTLSPSRLDIEKTAQILGKIQEIPKAVIDEELINLSRANLQGVNLAYSNFCRANFSGARLEGAIFAAARLEGADLRFAHLPGSFLVGAGLKRARIGAARLEGADLRYSDLEEAILSDAHLAQADLSEARLQRSDLSGARIQGADFRFAQLQEARLYFTQLDRDTDFTQANLEGAALRFVDLSQSTFDQDQLNAMFGDGSVSGLPNGIEWPEHWPRNDLGKYFEDEWRRWRDTRPKPPDPT